MSKLCQTIKIVSIACNPLSRTTHVQNKCFFIVTRNTIPCYILMYSLEQTVEGQTNHNAPTNGKGPLTNSKSTVNEQSNAPTEISTRGD